MEHVLKYRPPRIAALLMVATLDSLAAKEERMQTETATTMVPTLLIYCQVHSTARCPTPKMVGG